MLKGGRDGVAIIIDEEAASKSAIAELRAKLSDARQFFRGAAFRLDAARRALTRSASVTPSLRSSRSLASSCAKGRRPSEAPLLEDAAGACPFAWVFPRRQGTR